MAPLCLLYFVVVGSCLGVAGWLIERALPASAPRRWVWSVVLVLSVVLPIITSTHHASPAIGLWGYELARLPASDPMAARNWLDCGAPYGQAFMRLWGTAVALLAAWGLASAWRLSRAIRASRAAGSALGAPSLVDGGRVLLTDSIGPATVGIWRPRMLVPRWVLALPVAQRRYVLRHEDEHRRAHDAALLLVASLLAMLMPWNPTLWWHLRRLRLAVEMDCDRRVVAALGDSVAYGGLLLKVAQAASRGARPQPALLGVGMLERRLEGLLAPPPRRLLHRLLAPAVACVLLLVVLAVPHPLPERDAATPPQGRSVEHHAHAGGTPAPAGLPR